VGGGENYTEARTKQRAALSDQVEKLGFEIQHVGTVAQPRQLQGHIARIRGGTAEANRAIQDENQFLSGNARHRAFLERVAVQGLIDRRCVRHRQYGRYMQRDSALSQGLVAQRARNEDKAANHAYASGRDATRPDRIAAALAERDEQHHEG